MFLLGNLDINNVPKQFATVHGIEGGLSLGSSGECHKDESSAGVVSVSDFAELTEGLFQLVPQSGGHVAQSWDNLWKSRGGSRVNLCPRAVPRVINLPLGVD